MTRHLYPRLSGFPYRRGVSLVEIMVTVFIFAVILLIITAMFIVLLTTFNNNSAQSQLIQNASDTQTRFLADVNGAYGIEKSYTTYTSNATTLIVRAASLDGSGNPLANTCDTSGLNPCDHIVITANPNNITQLQEIILPHASSSRKATTKILAPHLLQYVFTYQNADAETSKDVYLAVTLSTDVGHSTITHSFRLYGKLRNAQ